MDNIMIPVKYMEIGYVFIPLFIGIFLWDKFAKSQFAKAFILSFKVMVYAGLAYLMWKFYQGKEQIDLISVFTFVFCCFEAIDNMVSLLCLRVYKRDMDEYDIKMYVLDTIEQSKEYDKM